MRLSGLRARFLCSDPSYTLSSLAHRKQAAPTAPPPPTSTTTPLPRFPPPTPAPDGSLPPPPPDTCPLGLPDVAVLSLDPLRLAPAGDDAPPTHALTFTSGPAALAAPALAALTAAVGWPARDPGRLETALAGSYYRAAVLLSPLEDGAATGTAAPLILIGAARATSDAAFNATLWDVLVHPAAQGRGVGAALVERATADLLAAGLGNVTLFSGKGSVGFYEGLGYEADPEGIKGMFHVGP